MADAMTLFGPAAEQIKPRTPPNESVVRKLVRLGVLEATARSFDNRQAYAVLAQKEQRREEEEREAAEAASPARASRPEVRGAPTPVRAAEAAELRRLVADRAGDEAVIRQMVGGCLYLLTPPELRRVAGGLATLLDGAKAAGA